MEIIKSGKSYIKSSDFHFICDRCNCEWYAPFQDPDLCCTPPGLEFFTFMKCPNCGRKCMDEENSHIIIQKMISSAEDKLRKRG